MRLALALLAVATAACGSTSSSSDTGDTGGDPPGVLEVEPNDLLGEAQAISIDGAVDGEKVTTGDVDLYRFVVPAGGQLLRIRIIHTAGQACSMYTNNFMVLKADGSDFIWAPGKPEGVCGDVLYQFAEGTYYVRIEGYLTFSYSLHIHPIDPANAVEVEPNDDGTPSGGADFDAAAAQGLFMAPTLIAASIGVTGDDDVFAVKNPRGIGATLHVRTFQTWDGVVGTCPSIDTAVRILDDAGSQLTYSDDINSLTQPYNFCSQTSYPLAAGATVYVRVTRSLEAGPIAAYLLLLEI